MQHIVIDLSRGPAERNAEQRCADIRDAIAAAGLTFDTEFKAVLHIAYTKMQAGIRPQRPRRLCDDLV